jgi:hypothetical protein
VGGRVVYDGDEPMRQGDPHVLRVLDIKTGQERWFSRDVALAGAGTDWIVAASRHGTSIDSDGEIRLYAP